MDRKTATGPSGKEKANPLASLEREDSYNLVFEKNPLPMWIFDLDDLRILAVNHAAVRHYGYTRKEFLAMTIQQLRPEESRESLDHYLATPRNPLQKAGVWQHRTKSGRVIDVEVTSHELHWRGHHARLVLANDVTEREVQARALKESEARNSAIVKRAMDCIIGMDEQGRITEFNPAAEKTFGYRRKEVMGQELAELIIPEELRVKHRSGLRRYFETGRGRIIGKRLELEAMRASGERFPVELTVVTNRHGGRTWFIGFLRDNTERRRNEEEIRALTEDLELKVQERTQRLDAVNRELEAFSYSVSHDLRAPLRSIDGFSQAVMEDLHDKLDDRSRRYLERVRAATGRMGELIDDLLSLARVSRSRVERKSLNLSDMARGIVDDLREREPERRIDFDIEPGIELEADPNLVKVILTNLLANAWKYTAKTGHAHVRVATQQDNGETAVCVSDDGAGFDPRYADKLFGAFQRLHSPAEFEGNGIGLATVQRVVSLHGGRVWAEGETGKGAAFYFTLGNGAGHE